MAKPIKHDLYQRRVGFSLVRDSRARDILRSLGADSRISDARSLRFAAEIGHVECARLLIPVSTPLLQNKPLLTAVLKSGGASILSHMLASEPLLLAGQNLFRLKAVAAANGHSELAALLSSIFEQASIVAHMSEPKGRSSLPRRL